MELLRTIGKWIYDFQTLLTGVAAVLAALWTIWQVRKQINQTNENRQDTIRRQNVSARAGMPKALSEICAYARESVDHVYEVFRLWSQNHAGRPFQPTHACPEYPQDAFDKIQRVIESADAKDAKILCEFISLAQVQNIRMSKILDNLNGTQNGPRFNMRELNFYGHLYDALGIYKFAERMFEYARIQRDDIGEICTGVEASNSLRMMLNVVNEELYGLVERRWPPNIPQMD